MENSLNSHVEHSLSDVRQPASIPEDLKKPLNEQVPTGYTTQSGGEDSTPQINQQNDSLRNSNSGPLRMPQNIPAALMVPLHDSPSKDPTPNCPESPPKTKSPPEFKLSPFAKEFVPRSFQVYRNVAPETGGGECDYPQQALRRFFQDVNLNPAKFQFRVENLANTLDAHTTPDTLPSIVDTIFDEAVQQVNFRYSGAKLCTFLCQRLQENSAFRDNLLQKCNKEFSKHKEYLASNNGEYVRGFVLFLAELYAQFKFSGEVQLDTLRDFMLAMSSTLLSEPSDDNLKCLCKILKMVGLYLIEHENSEGTVRQKLEGVVAGMVQESATAGQDVRNMVQSVLRLQESNWGQTPSPTEPIQTTPATASSTYYQPQHIDEPVFYGPDGMPFTQEERQFLQNNLGLDDCDDGDNYYDDDGLDDEMAAAYEQFLKETGQ